jgi:ribosomal protein S18 acetylase RimI-like enzyme
MKIEKATKDKVHDIVSLNSFVQEIHREHHPYHFKSSNLVPSEVYSFFDHIVTSENNYIFIAYKDNNPVGYIWFTIDNIPENPFKIARKQVYIHQIVVHKQYRQQSIGKFLLDKAEVIARQNNIDHYELDTWAFNSEAHVFFEKLGFKTFNIRMWKDAK